MAGDHAWEVYDIFHTALWQQPKDFGRKHGWAHSQTVFSLFLKGYSNNRQFVIVRERLAITCDWIPSIGRDLVSCNLKVAEPLLEAHKKHRRRLAALARDHIMKLREE